MYPFKLYLNEVLIGLAKLPLWCELSGNRVNNFCYADDIALLTPTENALQFILIHLLPSEKFFLSKSMSKSLVILS